MTNRGQFSKPQRRFALARMVRWGIVSWLEKSKQFMVWYKRHAAIGETMIRSLNNKCFCQFGECAGLTLLALLICCSLTALAQSTVRGGDTRAKFSIRTTHLLGF